MTDNNDIFQGDKVPDWLTATTEQENNFTVGHSPVFDGQFRAAPVVATPGCFFYVECGNGSSARGFEFGSAFGRECGT
ncbi:hypothetical protein MPTK1_2g26490 [Marchantia polymorpha subsp. ruderalis]|uniref:Uncharacterized protein n=1 Tax=Marchantia polymorpha TaxID=3197 RepID=A0A2R6XB42_MARPO|nr:hypothetical protein MARPO_0025s0035 [Marchantia polymorpha]BBN03795.1 hypothetical protein Mp_2g26490 [Marchantia polymorpha subsp. ruderalis]|eukprot:PTQ43340.1 hypothetical protein MARPO_0025s0035 [Marchantia polymorpha]